MKAKLILITYVMGGWGCSALTEHPASALSAFTSSSGASLCTISAGDKTIDMRGQENLPVGFVIDGNAVGIDAKGSGEWHKGAEVLGTYKIFRENADDKYIIILKWTDDTSQDSAPLSASQDSAPLSSSTTLQRIEYLTIASKDGTNLYTYHSGHHGDSGNSPSC